MLFGGVSAIVEVYTPFGLRSLLLRANVIQGKQIFSLDYEHKDKKVNNGRRIVVLAHVFKRSCFECKYSSHSSTDWQLFGGFPVRSQIVSRFTTTVQACMRDEPQAGGTSQQHGLEWLVNVFRKQ